MVKNFSTVIHAVWRRYQRHAVTLLYTIPKNAVAFTITNRWASGRTHVALCFQVA